MSITNKIDLLRIYMDGVDIVESCFSFLSDFDEEVYAKCLKVEEYYNEKDYSQVIISSSQISEDLTKKIANKENFLKLCNINQFERLKILGRMGIIRFNEQRPFDEIRKLNKDLMRNALENVYFSSKKAHKFLFDIIVWYYKKYNNGSKELTYYLPNSNSNVTEFKENTIELGESSDDENGENNFLFEEYKGSRLLGGLKNLEMGSKESVEGNNLSKFKNYLHVTRTIHKEFLEEVNRVSNLDSSHLIIICGSVGDGKSHLLAHFNESCPEIFQKFEIQGDGTESYDYDEDSLPSLAKNLEKFNDKNIISLVDDNNTFSSSEPKKFILAINLGILNNFLDSPFGENFKKLESIIFESGVLDNNLISNNYFSEEYPISIFSFADYNLFELTNGEENNFVTSDYLEELFNKITCDCDENPFYNSYMEDKKQLDINFDPNIATILNNYEIFSNHSVQKKIIEYIIKISIINKIIIPTRDILDLIYNIIVPPRLIDQEYFYSDYLSLSLPSLLFNYPNRSFLLSLFNQFDPNMLHNQLLDDLLIDLNINSNIKEIFEDYIIFSEVPLLEYHLDKISSFNELLPKQQLDIPQDLFRFLFFFGDSEKSQEFIDEDYLNFLKYLYDFNLHDHLRYRNLFDEVINAISKINGSKIGFLCINSLNHFKVYKTLNLNPLPYSKGGYECSLDESGRILNRFKLDIAVQFKINDEFESAPLFIDFSLYKYISLICRGYRPNKLDKEDLLVFEEFINDLKSAKNSKDMHIECIENNYTFKFGYESGFKQFYLKSD